MPFGRISIFGVRFRGPSVIAELEHLLLQAPVPLDFLFMTCVTLRDFDELKLRLEHLHQITRP
jgi:hypothetical protein